MHRGRAQFIWIGIILMASASTAKPVRIDLPYSLRDVQKNLNAALARARQIHQKEPEREIIITLPSGYIYLREPIVLGPQDSFVTLQGHEAGTIIGAGRIIRHWQPTDSHLWAAELPEVKTGEWDFRTLIVNGQWRRRAYLPRVGFFEHQSEYKEPWRSTTGGGFGVVPEELKRTMIYKPEDLGEWLAPANAELVIYHSWDTSHARIAAHDPATHTFTLTPPLGYPAGAFGIKRYRVENILEGLHTPGLWLLDREKGRVVYWPLPGEDMREARIMAPVGSWLVRLEGTSEQPIKNFRLRNLTLQDTNVPWKSPGFGASGIQESAIVLNHGVNCVLEDLKFRFLGGNAIKIHGGSDNCVIRCEISYIGASGIIASGGAQLGQGDNLLVADNYVHHIGLLYPSGIAIRVGNVAQAKICRNLIHDAGYSGIVFSGDFKNPRAVEGRIEHNHIFRVMTGLNDGGGIYVSGMLDGLIIRGNVCHDIHGLTGMGWGIYPDEQSRFITITGNLIYRCLGSFHCHMAHDITIENNIAIKGDQYHISLPKSHNISILRNIFVCEGEPLLASHIVKPQEHISQGDYNLLWDRRGGRPTLGKPSWEEWLGLGLDAHSIFADPLFVNAEADNYMLQPQSPAFSLGFKPLDLSKVPQP